MLTDDFGRNSAPTAASIEAPRRFQLWFPASVTSSRRGVDAFGAPSAAAVSKQPLTCLSVQTGVQEQAPVWAGVGRTPRSPRLTASSKISPFIHESVVFSPSLELENIHKISRSHKLNASDVINLSMCNKGQHVNSVS